MKTKLKLTLALCALISTCANALEVKIEAARFPAVPDKWNIEVLDNAVIYTAPLDAKKNAIPTTVKLTYTKKTNNQEARGFIDAYSMSHQCSDIKRVAHGFYTTTCKGSDTFAIAIGEVSNMYLIELTGIYDASAKSIINSYIKNITTGKHVFYDRTIGDERFGK